MRSSSPSNNLGGCYEKISEMFIVIFDAGY